MLLETLPIVHKSGNNSPKNILQENVAKDITKTLESDTLSEKLLIASVNSVNLSKSDTINHIILNSTINNSRISQNDLIEGKTL